jgi:hypothetical protein
MLPVSAKYICVRQDLVVVIQDLRLRISPRVKINVLELSVGQILINLNFVIRYVQNSELSYLYIAI